MNNQQSLTLRRRRSTGVGGSPSKQRKLVAVSRVAPPHSLLVPTQMLTQCQHFRLKGSPKRKNFKPRKNYVASVDGEYLYGLY